MNQKKRKNTKHTVLKNKLLQFILGILIIILLGGGLSYFITSVVLKATGHYKESAIWDMRDDSVGEQEENMDSNEGALADSNEAEVTLSNQTFSFESNTVNFLQVSSVTSEEAAKNAVNVFKNEGIATAYQSSNSNYKVFAFASSDKEELKQFRENFVFQYPKYSDSFIVSHDYKWDSVTLKLPADTDVDAAFVNTTINQLVDAVLEGQSTGVINTKVMQSIYDQIHSLNDLLYQSSDNEALDFTQSWHSLDEQVKNLMDRKASAVEYNSSLLKWLIDNTF